MKYSNRLLFYKALNYPIPKEFEQYYLPQDFVSEGSFEYKYETNNLLISQFQAVVKKRQPIFSHIPCIKSVFLCNSLTFDAIHSNSDIDLFIIAHKNRLWLARFFSVCIFHILNIRWYKNKKYKKFCLSFYVDENATNLYNISIKPYDIYLAYWIANLIPIYQQYNIWGQNEWIKSILPDFQKKEYFLQTNKKISSIKNFLDKILWTKLWDVLENFVKSIWKPIMLKKHKKNWNPWWEIISDNMLKFHWKDIRKNINFLVSLGKK